MVQPGVCRRVAPGSSSGSGIGAGGSRAISQGRDKSRQVCLSRRKMFSRRKMKSLFSWDFLLAVKVSSDQGKEGVCCTVLCMCLSCRGCNRIAWGVKGAAGAPTHT